MKRFFVLISNLISCAFLIWVFSIKAPWIETDYYSYVSVQNLHQSTEVSYDTVRVELTQLAKETDSLIGKQVITYDNKGNETKTYELFGQGDIPKDLRAASQVEIQQDENPLSTYFIFRGKCRTHTLAERLRNLGFEVNARETSIFSNLQAYLSNGFQLIAYLIFLLTFSSLTVIALVRSLRTSGIRLIAGERLGSLCFKTIGQDARDLFLAGIVTTVIGLALINFLKLPSITMPMLAVGILYYNLFLLCITIFFSFLFTLGLKRIHLINLIKGKLPLRTSLGLMLLGQFIAIIIIALGISRIFIYSSVFQEQEQGYRAWDEQKIFFNVRYGGLDKGQYDDLFKRQPKFFDEAIREQGALMVEHTYANYFLEKQMPDGTQLTDYAPQGNTFYVTPNYLDIQKVEVDKSIKEKAQHLQAGEFVLLLPEQLKADTEKYVKLFETELSDSEKKIQMTATVGYLKRNQRRFAYNSTPVSYQQFSKDPILVVITPTSTTGAAYIWNDHYILFQDRDKTTELLKKHGIYKYFAGFTYAYKAHHELLDNIRIEVLGTIAGAVLGILTSILLFNTMNLLYFEEFRREIFIKRVAGMRFLELHRSYLLVQLSVFLLGFGFSIFLTQNIWMSLIALLIFASNAFFLLQRQMKKEEAVAMTVLKGG